MKDKISKSESEEKIKKFFENLESKSQKEIKKIKTLAMSKRISLKEFKKKFCKFCLNPYSGKEKIRIKNGIKSVECKNCGRISRWRINN
jgi:RNase P subunit RPR2